MPLSDKRLHKIRDDQHGNLHYDKKTGIVENHSDIDSNNHVEKYGKLLPFLWLKMRMTREFRGFNFSKEVWFVVVLLDIKWKDLFSDPIYFVIIAPL